MSSLSSEYFYRNAAHSVCRYHVTLWELELRNGHKEMLTFWLLLLL